MTTENKKIGQKIKKARQSINLTQSQLGKAIGVTGSAIGYLEAGLRKINPDALKKIADELNKPFRYFFEDSGDDHSLQSKVISLEKDLKELLKSARAIEKSRIQNEIFYRDFIIESPKAIIFLNDSKKVLTANKAARVILKNILKAGSVAGINQVIEQNQKEIRENKPFSFSLPKATGKFYAKSVYEENGKYLGVWIMGN